MCPCSLTFGNDSRFSFVVVSFIFVFTSTAASRIMNVLSGKLQNFQTFGVGGCWGPYAYGLGSVACTVQSLTFFGCPLSCEVGHSTDDGGE